MNHRESARQAYSRMKPEAMDPLQGHGVGLEQHANKMVREGGKPSTEGYIQALTDRHNKDIEKLKSQAGRDKRARQHADLIHHIIANKKHFDKALEIHGHMQRAKDMLTRVMAKNNPFMHSIGGEATGPEGAVAVDKQGNMTKFVDRAEFSRQNFLMGKMQQQKKEQQNA